MDEVYVVQVATTGPKGAPSDGVAQICICRMLPDGSDFDTVYDAELSMDPRDIGKESLDYMSENYGLNAEGLYAGEACEDVVKEVQRIIFGRECTSYNVGNVFGMHLNFEPWDCTRRLTLLPSISMRGSTSSSGGHTTSSVPATLHASVTGRTRPPWPRWPCRS